jgi:hypothetical protein
MAGLLQSAGHDFAVHLVAGTAKIDQVNLHPVIDSQWAAEMGLALLVQFAIRNPCDK